MVTRCGLWKRCTSTVLVHMRARPTRSGASFCAPAPHQHNALFNSTLRAMHSWMHRNRERPAVLAALLHTVSYHRSRSHSEDTNRMPTVSTNTRAHCNILRVPTVCVAHSCVDIDGRVPAESRGTVPQALHLSQQRSRHVWVAALQHGGRRKTATDR